MKTYEVYKITNLVNNKLYIGITNQGFKTRWYKHCSDSIHGSEFPLHNALRKYGIDNFSVEVLEVCETIDQLKQQERYWITELKSRTTENGYNLTDGGDGTFGRKHSDETKDKIRQKTLDRCLDENFIKVLRNTRFKNKEIAQYDLEGNFITTFISASEAARIMKVSRSSICNCALGQSSNSKGYIWKYTGNTSEKMKSNYNIKEKVKKVTSEEVKQKISESNKLSWTEERKTKQSINNPKNKPILQYTLDGEFVKEYYNVSDAVKAVGATTHTNIAKCARGTRKKACGYIWKYKET
jgi:predicted GIY-YIG superfamily endonuclease